MKRMVGRKTLTHKYEPNITTWTGYVVRDGKAYVVPAKNYSSIF